MNGAPPTDEFVRDPATISDAITLANRFTGEELTSIRTTATHHAFFLYDEDHTYRFGDDGARNLKRNEGEDRGY